MHWVSIEQQWLVLGGTEYRVVLILDGTRYRACMPVYIEKVEISGRIDHQNDDDVMKRMVMMNRKLQFLKLPVQRG